LTHIDVRQAIEKRLTKAEFSVDDSIKEVAALAAAKVEKVTAADKLNANKLFLQFHGAIKEKDSAGRITVNIGFLQAPAANGAGTREMPTLAHVSLEPGE
jgi:hypothetical protein